MSSSTTPQLLRVVLDSSMFAGTFRRSEYHLNLEDPKDPISKGVLSMMNLGMSSPRNVLRIILHSDRNLPDFILPPTFVVKAKISIDGGESYNSIISDLYPETEVNDSYAAILLRDFHEDKTGTEFVMDFYAEEHIGVENIHLQSYGDLSVAQALAIYLEESPDPESLTPEQREIFAPYMNTARTLSKAFHDRGREWCDSVLGHARRSPLGIPELLTEAGNAH